MLNLDVYPILRLQFMIFDKYKVLSDKILFLTDHCLNKSHVYESNKKKLRKSISL